MAKKFGRADGDERPETECSLVNDVILQSGFLVFFVGCPKCVNEGKDVPYPYAAVSANIANVEGVEALLNQLSELVMKEVGRLEGTEESASTVAVLEVDIDTGRRSFLPVF